MCLTPITVKNPNYGAKLSGLNILKNCTSAYIDVPCGHCPECIALKQMYFVQRVIMESLGHYLFFGTLTYNNENLPKLEVNKRKIYFADIRDIQLMFKRIRNNNLFPRDFRYVVVSEFGTLKHRPHFHFLLSIPKYKTDDDFTPLRLERELYDNFLMCWARNVGTRKNPRYVQNCTLFRKFVDRKLSYNFDCHYIAPSLTNDGVSNPAYYCIKYMLKGSDYSNRLQQALHLNLDQETYKEIWNKVKPRFVFSKGFGLLKHNSRKVYEKLSAEDFDDEISDYIKKCIRFSRQVSDYPLFVHPDTGNTFPLSSLYRKYFLSVDDALYFHSKGFGLDTDSFFESKHLSQDEILEYARLFNKMVKTATNHDSTDII